MNPLIYEINTRVWIRQFDTPSERATLDDVPEQVWIDLKKNGFDAVWLMGVWKTSKDLIEKCCFESGLVQSYDKALGDWKKEDVIGSPYSIEAYRVSPDLGTTAELRWLKGIMNQHGLSLILDFIPNHFGASTPLLKEMPEAFLQVSRETFESDPYSFFESPFQSGVYFAHGRDPFFAAWTDTVQINYFSPLARELMLQQMMLISDWCDGIRCDMAMLTLNNVFHNTWASAIDTEQYPKPEQEFWKTAIQSVKNEYPEFLFIAEAYWNLEWSMQQLGFDYTYDKKLYDRLRYNHANYIRDHLNADAEYRRKLVRFIENHDEERAVTVFGQEKAFAAVTLIGTIEGMRMFQDGQCQGRRIKLPVQLGREPKENANPYIKEQYSKLFSIIKADIFKFGEWTLLDTHPVGEKESSHNDIIVYVWTYGYDTEHRLVAVNYSDGTAQCRVKYEYEGSAINEITLTDLLTGAEYTRTVMELQDPGLFISLGPYQSHIFKF